MLEEIISVALKDLSPTAKADVRNRMAVIFEKHPKGIDEFLVCLRSNYGLSDASIVNLLWASTIQQFIKMAVKYLVIGGIIGITISFLMWIL